MIPFGHWRPDAESINAALVVSAKNCLPSVQGFRPLRAPIVAEADTGSGGLDGRCVGATTILLEDGSNVSFAGTSSKLYQLGSDNAWDDVSRTTGGAYAVPSGEEWRFDVFGDNLIAVNFVDDPQKFDMSGGTNFTALGGSPPKARYIGIVREFVVLGCINGNERRVQWSAIGDSEAWTPGTNSSDYQDFPSGGPVRGIIGGEVGYVFQSEKITRMTFAPGSDEVFQFDEVEGGRGCKSAGSLIKVGNRAYYYAGDGFYMFDLGGGSSAPIGVGKWANWFLGDMRAGTENEIRAAVSPVDRAIFWAYISRGNSSTTPDKVLIYDWALDEATTADISIEAMSQWLSQGYTMETIGAFGTLDDLPYSLDSPFWKGGTPLMAVFNASHQLSYLQGDLMPAEWETCDGQAETRSMIKATRPHIDTTALSVAIAMRERDGDTWLWPMEERMEDTGEVPAWASGNLARARIRTDSGAVWTFAKGIKTIQGGAGKR